MTVPASRRQFLFAGEPAEVGELLYLRSPPLEICPTARRQVQVKKLQGGPTPPVVAAIRFVFSLLAAWSAD